MSTVRNNKRGGFLETLPMLMRFYPMTSTVVFPLHDKSVYHIKKPCLNTRLSDKEQIFKNVD